jgi:endoglucanase
MRKAAGKNVKVFELGRGPACSLMDGATIYNPQLVRRVAETAEKTVFSLQFRRSIRPQVTMPAVSTRPVRA